MPFGPTRWPSDTETVAMSAATASVIAVAMAKTDPITRKLIPLRIRHLPLLLRPRPSRGRGLLMVMLDGTPEPSASSRLARM